VFDSVSGSGIYSTPLPFAAGTRFIAVMHDAQGIGNGGVSTIYTVEGSDNAECLPKQQGNNTLAFSLMPSPPTQCDFQGISWAPLDPNGNGDDMKNVNITGYVPGGLAFKLNLAGAGLVSTGNSASWQTSVPQGQDFMFFYERTDPATGTLRRETSAIQNVQPGPKSDCIVQGGPSVTPPAVYPSTSNQISSTATQTSSTLALELLGGMNSNGKGPFNLPYASTAPLYVDSLTFFSRKSALIGIIVGGICFIAIIVAFLYLFYVRKQRKPKFSPLEDGRQTVMSNESRAALIKLDPDAPMGISLPPLRASGFGIASFSQYGTTTMSSPTPTAQVARSPPLDVARQRGGLFGRKREHQENVNSVASWGNTGPLTKSIIEPKPEPEPKPVPMDAMSDISEYSALDFVPLPPPPAMSRGGSGPGRQRAYVDRYPPRSNSSGSGARPGSSKSRDGGYTSEVKGRPPARAQDSLEREYSSMEPRNHIDSISAPVLPSPSSLGGRNLIQNYYLAPVQPPSRATPLVQRQLSVYEGENDYDNDGSGRTRTGAPVFRPAPDGQFGIAL
jgi:hypothetical protein